MANPKSPAHQPAHNHPHLSATPQQPYSQSGYSGAESEPSAYGYPAPGAASYGQQPQMVIVMPQPQTVVVARYDSVSMIGVIVLSCFVTWCCFILFGFTAFILALVGWNHSSDGNEKGAIQLKNASYVVSVVGIVVGIIITILVYLNVIRIF